jgi:hypothetical protein
MKRMLLLLLLTVLSFVFLSSISGAEPVAAKTPGPAKLSDAEVATLLAKGAERQNAGEREVALHYYRQAAAEGNSEAAYRAGALAWITADAKESRARLLKLDSGLRSFFQAATNRHAGACTKLSQAYREGLLVRPDSTMAYAWLLAAKQLDPKTPTELLDELVVQLSPPAIRQAQNEARRWLAGQWPESIAPEIVQGDARFKINGLTGGAMPIVVINSRTLGEGDSASLPSLLAAASHANSKSAAASTVDVTCLTIGLDYVLLRVAAEQPLVLLPLSVN